MEKNLHKVLAFAIKSPGHYSDGPSGQVILVSIVQIWLSGILEK